jgi:hypothetical protein
VGLNARNVSSLDLILEYSPEIDCSVVSNLQIFADLWGIILSAVI